jgi:hypothetical protein
MLRIHASIHPPARYYLCRECGAIREDPTRGDGTMADETRWHELESTDLPAAVVEQVRAILEQPSFGQLSFLPDEE